MKNYIFLSYPKPFLKEQTEFIDRITDYLVQRGYEPRTLGITDMDEGQPLIAIQNLLSQCSGVLMVAFRRTLIKQGICKPQSDLKQQSSMIRGEWITSPWCHIEASMASQTGLPILIFREKDVIADGILESKILNDESIEFDLTQPSDREMKSKRWRKQLEEWQEKCSIQEERNIRYCEFTKKSRNKV
ncbi:hypothetical protein lbkm_0277 [Lachnospiraceae bacterium KM106-2]|nr:hypothetical protein lbkm_0277 [Lachnospiraceae bacterium KM106-2]